jgi:hypothetical protein
MEALQMKNEKMPAIVVITVFRGSSGGWFEQAGVGLKSKQTELATARSARV